MAKPRVFISSTFYDLKQVRSDLDFFIDQLGYEAVRNEEGDIPYGNKDALEEYCYREIKNVDILVCIIGSRFGSESKKSKHSVTQTELKTAHREGKQIYIFIDSNVLSEFETYLLNKESQVKYKYVDNVKIYEFIEEIRSLGVNNVIKGFETATDITKFLKEQFAGLFQRFLEQQTRVKEVSVIKGLENTANTLNKLVNYLSVENKEKTQEINKILMIQHPLVEQLKTAFDINYNIYIEGIEDLSSFLKFLGFASYTDEESSYSWQYNSSNYFNSKSLTISKNVFDIDGRLKYFKKADWNNSFFKIEEKEDDEDDLPF